MSDKLMDTEPGGEQTQYEGVHTFVEPHSKQAGQMGGKNSPIPLILPPITLPSFSAQIPPSCLVLHNICKG
jgi:hypothetical protein